MGRSKALTIEERVADIGARLTRARKRAGLNQLDVAEHLEVSQSTVCRWETGYYAMPVGAILHIARLLRMNPQLLLPRE